MAKSLCLSYLLWMTGGLFGLHHFYLRRDEQAFVWWSTCGGWILGWMRDFFRLPHYVREANSVELHTPVPRVAVLNWERCIGAVFLGAFYGLIIRLCVPEEYVSQSLLLLYIVKIAVPLGVAVGVHLVSNIGREVSSFQTALIGAYVVLPFTLAMAEDNIFYTAVASVLNVRWQGVVIVPDKRRHSSFIARCSILGLGAVIYIVLCSSILLCNIYVHTETGERIPLRTAAYNFYHSKAFKNLRATLWHLFEHLKTYGREGFYDELNRKFDTSGMEHALEVLEANENMTENEIRKNYKSLARKWHPDKFHTEEERAIAQEKFIEIQSAWETVSTMKGKREWRNRQSRKKTEP